MKPQPGRIGFRLTDAECEQIEALIEAHGFSWLVERLHVNDASLERVRYGGRACKEETVDKISAGLKGLR